MSNHKPKPRAMQDLGQRSAWAAALSVLSEATCHDISNGTVSAALAAFHKVRSHKQTCSLCQKSGDDVE